MKTHPLPSQISHFLLISVPVMSQMRHSSQFFAVTAIRQMPRWPSPHRWEWLIRTAAHVAT
jgi:hypothetical protein